MSWNRSAVLLALTAIHAWGCGDSSLRDDASATVTGSLALAEYPGLSAPVVVAQNADGSYVSGAAHADGSFRLSIPAGAAYRLSIAHVSGSGTLVIVAHIRLSDTAFWARYERGGKVDLGEIRPGADQAHAYDDSYDDYDYDDSDYHADDHACAPAYANADLPYDVKLEVGDTFRLSDAFAEKGPLPAAIVSVTMEGEPWRLSELKTDSPFVVTEADCGHEGNRDIGRDRIFVTWKNADGSRETDHLDLRYCESSSGGSDSSGSGSGHSGSENGDKDSDYPEHDAGCAPPPGQVPPPVCAPPTPPVSTCGEADLTHVTPLPAPPHAESTCIKRDDPPPGEGSAAGVELL